MKEARGRRSQEGSRPLRTKRVTAAVRARPGREEDRCWLRSRRQSIVAHIPAMMRKASRLACRRAASLASMRQRARPSTYRPGARGCPGASQPGLEGGALPALPTHTPQASLVHPLLHYSPVRVLVAPASACRHTHADRIPWSSGGHQMASAGGDGTGGLVNKAGHAPRRRHIPLVGGLFDSPPRSLNLQ